MLFRSRKTAENLVAHLENAIKTVQIDYLAFLVAVVTDVPSEKSSKWSTVRATLPLTLLVS